VRTGEPTECFLNVDLDLTFEGDISPLVLAFGSSLTEMHRREGFAVFELRDIQPRDADEAIEEYWKLARTLTPLARAIWDCCRKRTMNVGVDAPAGHSVDFAISGESVGRLRELGADIVLTVYRRVT